MGQIIGIFVRMCAVSAFVVLLFYVGLIAAAVAFLTIVAGQFYNLLVITTNGGKMPVVVDDRHALLQLENETIHCVLDKKSRFALLADRIKFRDEEYTYIYSVGDLMQNVGAFLSPFALAIDFFIDWPFA